MKKYFIFISILIFHLISSPSSAKKLKFIDMLDKAVKNSFDLKISQIDIKISKAGVKEARSEYFPSLSAGFYNSYDRDLSNSTSGINSVGDSVVIGATKFQNALSLGLQYDLFDFGVKGKRLLIAKKDCTQKEIEYEKQLRNLKIELADIYTNALTAYKEIQFNKELLRLNKELFGMYEKLDTAGTVRKTELTDQALKVARLINKLDNNKTQFKIALEDLSLKTGEEYNIENLEILNLYAKENSFEPVSFKQEKNKDGVIQLEAVESKFIDVEKLPEYKTYQLEIEKKKAELSLLRRQALPDTKFITGYYLYGTNKSDYFDAMRDFKQRSLSFRISTSFPIFDGFKNFAQREKTKLQIERLEQERDSKIEKIKNYYEKLYEESKDFAGKYENQEKSLKLVREKIQMLEKLNDQELIDKVTYLSQKNDLLSQELEIEKSIIENEANSYKLSVLAGLEFLPENSEPETQLNTEPDKNIPLNTSVNDQSIIELMPIDYSQNNNISREE
jgi:outer membrane protein